MEYIVYFNLGSYDERFDMGRRFEYYQSQIWYEMSITRCDYLQADCSELWHMHISCDASSMQEFYCIYNCSRFLTKVATPILMIELRFMSRAVANGEVLVHGYVLSYIMAMC